MVQYNIEKISNNNIKMTPIMENKKFIEEAKLNKVISTMKDRVEREIHDVGFFRNFAESYRNNDPNLNTRSISLYVEKDKQIEGKAYLCVSLLHPTDCEESSRLLKHGNRKELLKYMNEDGFKENLEKQIKEIADEF